MPNNPTNLFTNAHSHIFTVSDAPDYFLKTAIKSKWLAELVDKMLQKKGTRAVLQAIHWIIKPFSPNYRNTVERYIEFVEIGTSATQQEILDKESQAYSKVGTYRIVALTQVLDYLDYNQTSNHKKIQTQVEEVANLKRNALYQDRLYPFLGIDPRMQGTDLLQWVKKYVSKDYGFYGIKIYPAYGFFPFDNRLAPVWEWAAGEGIPVMSHSTRGGSFYLGNFSSILNSGGFVPQSLNPNSATMPAIKDRINSLVKDGSVQKNNKVWCNIFGHIDNYRVVLEDNRFKN
ncbi:MAG TPA: hypothetical protein VKQ52_13325, partial [Puia sp.]|nr:hypothetical protein [Puia sp.]